MTWQFWNSALVTGGLLRGGVDFGFCFGGFKKGLLLRNGFWVFCGRWDGRSRGLCGAKVMPRSFDLERPF